MMTIPKPITGEQALMTIPNSITHYSHLLSERKKKEMQKTKKRKQSNMPTPTSQEEEEEESVEKAAATVEEEGQLMAMVPQLPKEILMDILSRLPVKTLLRFRCVSKGWRTLISDPNFITQHLNRSGENSHHLLILGELEWKQMLNINYETSSEVLRYDFSKFSCGLSWLEIVGSSNGLVCLCFSHASFKEKGNILYLCNPATLEIKLLPNAPIKYTKAWDFSYTAFGFGFDSIANDYKVVSIDYFEMNGMLEGTIHPSEVKVYSLSTGRWRRLEDASFNIRIDKSKFMKAEVNGAVHLMGNYGNFDSEFIISFDVALETFCKIPGHDQYRHGDKLYNKKVGVLGGCLSVFDVYTSYCIEIWVMKDYGVKDSWTQLFTIYSPPPFSVCSCTGTDPFDSTTPIAIRKNGEVVLAKDVGLVSYDPKSGREKAIGPHTLPLDLRSVTYVESLVSLKVGNGQGRKP